MAGKKFSDVYRTSNTNYVANTDLFIIERADGNTYALQASVLTVNGGGVANTTLSRSVYLINNANSYSANNTYDVILCDCNAANSDITITLPVAANNKMYTIKNINPGGHSVIVTTSNTSTMFVENATGGGVGTATSLTSPGEVYTWVAYDGTYRKIG